MKILMRLAAIAALTWCASAATRITLSLKINDGTTDASGYVYITGPKGSGVAVTTSRKITLVNGVFDTTLLGGPAYSYDVEYHFTDSRGRAIISPPNERWSVPDTATTITDRNVLLGGPAAYNLVNQNDINSAGLAPGQMWVWDGTAWTAAYPSEAATVPFASITGDPQDNAALSTALAQKMAALPGSGAVKMVSGVPALVTGNAADCVKVDGSSGACGTGTTGGPVAFADLTGEPTENTALNSALSAKVDLMSFVAHTLAQNNPHVVTKAQIGLANVTNDTQLKAASNLSDLANVVTARANLGLGGAAVANVGTASGEVAAGNHNHTGIYAPFSHIHAASEVTSGVFNCARLGSGCGGGGTKVLWDNGTWSEPPGASGGEANTSSNGGTGGIGIVLPKSGTDLPFKSLYAGSTKITLTDDTTNKRVTIDVDPSALDHGLLLNHGTNTHAQIDTHLAATNNPHGTTAAQVGLGNVDNTSDANKPVSTATQTALNLKANLAGPTFTGTPAAPTAAADTNTTQLATTAFVLGQAGSSNPVMNGSVAVGTSLKYSRQDHVHPTDTTRAPLASPVLTGTPTAPTAAADTNTTQVATTAYVIGQKGTATPAMDGTGAAGTSNKWTPIDHVHPTDTSRAATTGTSATSFQVDSGNSGPRWKNNSGTMEARNAADSALAPIRGSVVYSGDGTAAGETVMNELLANGSNYRSWGVPDALTADLKMMFPDAVPSAGDTLLLGAPSGGVSAITFGKPVASALAAAYVDWNASSGGASIQNKPTLGTIAAKNATATGGKCAQWSADGTALVSATDACGTGSGGLLATATWAQMEAGTAGTGSITGTMTWAQVEAQ